MAISIICSNCGASYNVPPHLAGKTVTCKRCEALLDVPGGGGGYRAPVAAGRSGYNRVVGKPNPIALEVLGIDGRFEGEFGPREIFKLLWSCRHIVLLILVLILWSRYSATALTAQYAAPFFFFGGIVVILAGWIQLMTISRNLAANISGNRSASILPYIISSFLLFVTDFRAALPGVRTLFLGTVALIASLSLASQAGGVRYVLPLHLMPSFGTQERKPAPGYTPLPTADPNQQPVTTTPKVDRPAPPPPPPPPVDDKPLPPPEEALPPPS